MKNLAYYLSPLVSIYVILCVVFVSCTEEKTQPEENKDSFKDKISTIDEFKSHVTPPKESKKYTYFEPAVDFRFAAAKATEAVVHIKSYLVPEYDYQEDQEEPSKYESFLEKFFGKGFFRRKGGPGFFPSEAAGSGVILTDEGHIITNYHVIEDANEIEVILHDRRTFTAEVIGTDPTTDLALIKINASELAYLEYGNSDEAMVGEWVLAVGNPFNLASTVTAGIISAKARNINLLSEKSAIESFIQTDAAVNPGNSGGALVNLQGELIGINTAIATKTGSFAGYSFAVPVNIARKIVDDLLNFGMVQRGYLGVMIRDLNSEKALELGIDHSTGVLVESVMPSSGADEAGILENDVVIQIEKEVIVSSPQLQEVVGRKRPGDHISVVVERNGQKLVFEVELKNDEGNTELINKSLNDLEYP